MGKDQNKFRWNRTFKYESEVILLILPILCCLILPISNYLLEVIILGYCNFTTSQLSWNNLKQTRMMNKTPGWKHIENKHNLKAT